MTRAAAETAALRRAGEIARMCIAAGAPRLIARLVADPRPVEEIAGELSRYAGIRDAVAAAARVNLAVDPAITDKLFDRGLSVAEARAELAKLPMLARRAAPASWALFAPRGGKEGNRNV